MPSLSIRRVYAAGLRFPLALTVAFCATALLAPVWPSPDTARAATITLCPSGCDHSTLAAAVSAAAAGDVIEIGEGEYIGGVTIDKALTLRGAGADQVTLRGGGTTGPVLYIQNQAAGPLDRAYAVQVEKLTITEGSGHKIDVNRYGAGMYIKGANVTVNDCTIRNNSVGYDGGGIYNDAGTLTVRNSRIVDNRAFNSGGGIYNDYDGTLNLIDSLVANNIAMNPPDVDPTRETFATGGGIVSRERATIAGSRIENNVSGTWGGGVYVFGAGRVDITASEIISNSSGEGGGLYLSAKVELADVLFENNEAEENGGGIFNMGELTVEGIYLKGNRANNGGGVSVMKGFAAAQRGEMVMTRATFEGNVATTAGGGLFAEREADVEVTLCTISGNSALTGGGVRAEAADKVELTECTVAANQASLSESAAGLSTTQSNVLRLAGTIVANDDGKDCQGPVRSDGHNLDEDGSCAFNRNSDISSGFAGLRDLDNYGGTLRVHALTSASDAIDTGHPNRCQAADQRGVTRPQDGDEDGQAICDIGSFELEGVSPPTATPGMTPATATPVEPTPTAPTPTGPAPTPSATRDPDGGTPIYLPRVLREG